jgi:hypothetical protein
MMTALNSTILLRYGARKPYMGAQIKIRDAHLRLYRSQGSITTTVAPWANLTLKK